MGKAPCCSKVGLQKGPWSSKEDALLTNYIQTNGEGQWRSLPKKAGLLRCGKSCRLRWMNYLRPGIKRGNISTDEEDLIIRLHSLLGNRWSLIAGRLPGRTDNEIKNYWNTHLIKRLKTAGIQPKKPPKHSKKKLPTINEAPAPETMNNPNPKKKQKIKNSSTINEAPAPAAPAPAPAPAPARARAPETMNPNPKKKQKIKNSSTIHEAPAPAPALEAPAPAKIKVYVPKPIRVSPGFSSNNTMDSPLSSSASHEEVNNNKETKVSIDEMSDFEWPLIELEVGDHNYGTIQVCEDDQLLIQGCDFSLEDSMPTISNMLEQVYDEYFQCL